MFFLTFHMYIEYTNSYIFLTAIYQYLFNIWARPGSHRCTLLCLEPLYGLLGVMSANVDLEQKPKPEG